MPTPKQLANLRPRRAKNTNGQRRTIWASTRICPESKQNLNIILEKMNMSLADFLEAIARNELEVVKK